MAAAASLNQNNCKQNDVQPRNARMIAKIRTVAILEATRLVLITKGMATKTATTTTNDKHHCDSRGNDSQDPKNSNRYLSDGSQWNWRRHGIVSADLENSCMY